MHDAFKLNKSLSCKALQPVQEFKLCCREIVPMSMWLINPSERIRGTFPEELYNGSTRLSPQVSVLGLPVLFSVGQFTIVLWAHVFLAMLNIQRENILGPSDICHTAFVQLCLPLELWWYKNTEEVIEDHAGKLYRIKNILLLCVAGIRWCILL